MAYWKNLINLHPNMTRFTWSCSSVKTFILTLSTELFNWSAMLLRTLSTAEEKQFNEVNPVPTEIQNDVLEASVYKALSLTGVNVAPEDLHAYHRMKRLDRVIIKFKCCKQKQSVMYKHKNLGTKSQELSNLKFMGRLFVSKNMFVENQQLAYKC